MENKELITDITMNKLRKIIFDVLYKNPYYNQGVIASEILAKAIPIIQKAERERIIGLLLDPDWKLLCEDNDGACSGCKGFYQALKEGGKEAE